MNLVAEFGLIAAMFGATSTTVFMFLTDSGQIWSDVRHCLADFGQFLANTVIFPRS